MKKNLKKALRKATTGTIMQEQYPTNFDIVMKILNKGGTNEVNQASLPAGVYNNTLENTSADVPDNVPS